MNTAWWIQDCSASPDPAKRCSNGTASTRCIGAGRRSTSAPRHPATSCCRGDHLPATRNTSLSGTASSDSRATRLKETRLHLVPHNPDSLFPPYRGYAHAMEIAGSSRLLFISGLNGFEKDGTTMPESFDEQAELIWSHIRSILASAGM